MALIVCIPTRKKKKKKRTRRVKFFDFRNSQRCFSFCILILFLSSPSHITMLSIIGGLAKTRHCRLPRYVHILFYLYFYFYCFYDSEIFLLRKLIIFILVSVINAGVTQSKLFGVYVSSILFDKININNAINNSN